MQNRRKIGSKQSTAAFFRSKGLYLILAVCVLAAACVSLVRLQTGKNQINRTNEQLVSMQKKTNSAAQTERPQSGQEKSSGASSLSSGASSSSGTRSAAAEGINSSGGAQGSQKCLYILPVAGEVGEKFSGDEMIYYPTLKLWRVHQALDVLAPEKTPVKAIADGTVTKIFEDAVLGVAVEITHTDGKISTVYGLASKTLVRENQTVRLGEALGTVSGVPAEAERTGVHLVLKDEQGRVIDPLNVISLSA